MEGIRGKRSFSVDAAALAELVSRYEDVLIDLGTGDGRYVRHVAETAPQCLAIGVDASRENLREHSRRAPANALYLIANALALPEELAGVATRLSINFPWGSLLAGLLDGHKGLLAGLAMVARPGAILELRLNAGALVEIGWPLGVGLARARQILRDWGWWMDPPMELDAWALSLLPMTWAKRLACGRDPRAVYI